MFKTTNKLVLGRGKVLFDRQRDDGTYEGYRYIGNTPGFTLSIASESLTHVSSDEGINEVDATITTSVTRTGKITTDNIDRENLALALMGESEVLAVVGATIADETFTNVAQGRHYQLGVSDTQPGGARGLVEHSSGVNVVVTDDAGTPATFVEGTDYEIDMELGLLYIIPGGGIESGTNIEVDYKTGATSRERVISGNQKINGRLKFVAFNPEGENRDLYLPKVQIAPTGDIDFKKADWTTLEYDLSILKPSGQEAIYLDGRPYTA